MADVSWAQNQIVLGNSVRRAAYTAVYLKAHNPTWAPWGTVSCFFANDDSLANTGTYTYSIDDCAATDWELHT